MSKAEEKRTPLDLLEHRLRIAGLADEVASRNLLEALKPHRIPGLVVEAIDQLLTLAMERQRQRFRKSLEDILAKM